MAYVSQLAPPERRIIQDDFAGIENLVVGKVAAQNGVAHHNVKFWNRHIAAMPADICSVLRGHFGCAVALDLSLQNDRAIDVNMRPVEGEDFRSLLAVDIGAPPVFHDSEIDILPPAQGNGIGRAWLRAMVEFSAALGFPHFRFSAGLENGGYVWGRAGVNIDYKAAEHRTLEHLSRQLIGRLDALRPALPPSTYHRARALSRLVAKEDMASLAAMDVPVDTMDGQALTHGFQAFYKDNASVLGLAETVETEVDKLTRCFARAGQMGQPATLGQLLLARVSWKAIVDFADTAQMESIGRYVGGWDTIAPARGAAP